MRRVEAQKGTICLLHLFLLHTFEVGKAFTYGSLFSRSRVLRSR